MVVNNNSSGKLLAIILPCPFLCCPHTPKHRHTQHTQAQHTQAPQSAFASHLLKQAKGLFILHLRGLQVCFFLFLFACFPLLVNAYERWGEVKGDATPALHYRIARDNPARVANPLEPRSCGERREGGGGQSANGQRGGCPGRAVHGADSGSATLAIPNNPRPLSRGCLKCKARHTARREEDEGSVCVCVRVYVFKTLTLQTCYLVL